jgi:hypothetical protein
MSYTVVWLPVAENQLARLWTNFADRQAIADAADALDDLLRSDPHGQGESRYGDVRIMFVPPLAALFEIREPDRLVRVLKVWRSRRRP